MAETTKKKPAAKRKPKYDTDELRRIADLISGFPDPGRTDLIHRLETEEGMKSRETSEGRIYVKIAKLEVGTRGTMGRAIQNWGNRARRIAQGLG